MVGDRKEVVTALPVPIGDHFREIVPVAPKRVGVKISLPPFRLGIRVRLGIRASPIRLEGLLLREKGEGVLDQQVG